MQTKRGVGAPRGLVQRDKVPRYDPASGRKYTPNPKFRPSEGAKLVTASVMSGISATELLTQLVQRMEVDELGRPVWWHEVAVPRRQDQEELPLTG